MLNEPGDDALNQFDYTAQCKSGAAIRGSLEAQDGAAATESLHAMGLCNIDVRPADRPLPRGSLSADDFVFFNEQLASLADAGMCLDEGLRELGKDTHSRRLRRVLEAVADDVRQGQPLDRAIEIHAPQMPALYSRVVRAGIKTGRLSGTLLNLSHHLRLVAETRRLLAEAITYPVIVLFLAFGVFCAVLLFVVPQFVDVFMDFGVRLPALTMAMISLSRGLPQLLQIGGLLIALMVLLLLGLRYSANGRAWRERMIMAIPILGSMIRHSIGARFLRALAFAVDSGMPLPEALRLSAGATGSPGLLKEVGEVALRVERGSRLDEACRGARLVPALFGYFATVNSDISTLRDGLIQLSKAYEARALSVQSSLRSWVAPLAMLGVGLVIGVLVVALFMPLVQLIQSVSG